MKPKLPPKAAADVTAVAPKSPPVPSAQVIEARMRAAMPPDAMQRMFGTLPKMKGGMHSPARDTQAFNETFLGNANVPQVGLVTGNPGSYSNPSNGNAISGAVVQTDGTASPRANTQTFQAGINSTPSGKISWPAGVDTFTDKAGEDPEK